MAVGFVFSVTFLFHAPILSHEFVWDDLQISVDPYIHDASHWPEVLTFRTLAHDVLDNNRPVALLTLMLDAMTSGKNPTGYHLTNIVLHAANAALVCLIAAHMLRRSTSPKRPSSLWIAFSASTAALLFALHPLVVEPVSVVAFREDPQAAFFVLVSLAFALRLDAATRPWQRWLLVGVVLISVTLAIGTKESAIAAPFLLLACWWATHPQRDTPPAGRVRPQPRAWAVVLAGSFFVSGAFLVARFTLPPWPSEVYLAAPRRIAETWTEWLSLQSRINAFHLEHIVRPVALTSDYTPQSYAHISTLSGVLQTVSLSLLVLWLARWHRLALFGAVLVVAGMATVSNVVPLYNPVADRYLYLPLIGGALVIAALLGGSRNRFTRSTLLVASAAALAVLATLHVARRQVFHDDLALWTDALKKNPHSAVACNLRGWALYARGEHASALASFEQALRISGGFEPDSWAGGALACFALGDKAEAERAYRRAVELLPHFRDPARIQRAYFWREEYLQRLAEIGRGTGLWIETEKPEAAAARLATTSP